MDMQEKTYCRIRDLGLIEYEQAYSEQKRHVGDVLNGGPQTILLCEHPAILTRGRLADDRHILLPKEYLEERGIKVRSIDRGGDITLHAPGQLVVYPIFNLAEHGKDLRFFMHCLEQVTIDLLGKFDIVANRFSGKTGVWMGGQKIASIGIGVRRWISYHGLAVNVIMDLRLYSMIKPCGLDVTMTSIARIKTEKIDMRQVKEEMVDCFNRHFSLDGLREGAC